MRSVSALMNPNKAIYCSDLLVGKMLHFTRLVYA